MGFDAGQIILDSNNGAYYSGQTIYGRIVFDQGKPKTIHGIYVSFKGFCKVHWTTSETRRDGDRDVEETIVHESYEEYFNRKTYIMGAEHGEHELNPGHYDIKFDFPVPINCPSSFEGEFGHIRYRVKVVMVTSGIFSSNKEKMVSLRMFAPIDLNLNPHCKEPVEFEMINKYCCWCVSAGSSEIRVKMPVGGYCPGQVIPLEISVINLSSVDIEELKFQIKKDIRFEATSRPGTRHDRKTIAEIKKGPIPASTTRNWNLDMQVPIMDVFNFNGCRFIHSDYEFKVSTEVSGCHEGNSESHPIVFGTTPIVGFQDNVVNPLADQMPKQNLQAIATYPPPPITNQPISNNSYPSNTPYPGAPYPTPNPNTGSPYPNTGSPYPPNNQPYPNTGSPYPPHPSNDYKNQNTPYPGSNPAPPYPGSNTAPPYPGSNAAPPYPGNNPAPPYPGGNMNVSNNSSLKTGNFGFTVAGGDPAGMPLLPPNTNVPYPTSPAGNPYSSASAPEPSTPGNESKIEMGPYPAYNPDYKN